MGLPKCIELDIAIVCAGYNSSRTVVTLVKSILFYRHHPIHFHFITDEATKNVMETLFETWLLPQVNYMLYQYFATVHINTKPTKPIPNLPNLVQNWYI